MEFGRFFLNKHKEQFLMNSWENIYVKKLSKYYRGGMEGKKFQWNCKRKQSKSLRKLYSRHLNRFSNRVTFLYFYFFTFLEKVHNFGLLSWNCFKIWKLLGLYKSKTSSLKFSSKWNFTVYSAFLPTTEKISLKTQLHLFEKPNREKRPCNNQGSSGYN